MDKCLCAQNIYKSYKDNCVLSGLNLTLEPGKIYGLLGRNGAGKTTLLGVLTAQNSLDSGSVTYGGEPVWENRRALDDICFSRELSGTNLSGQNTFKISFYLKAASMFYKHWDGEYAEKLLDEFHLDPDKQICKLSKGQMSMVTIVLGLASRAPLTIFDEPVSGLDVVMRERFYRLLLDDYAETERTFVVSTHIIEEAAGAFEEVIFLDGGRIIEKAPTEELISQFAYISGLEREVQKAAAGLQVLNRSSIGARTVYAVRGVKPGFRPDADVDVTPMNLQKVFVTMCGHGEEM